MLLKKKDLLVCLYARGHENIMGFEETAPEMDELTRQSFRTNLMEKNLLEQNPQAPEGYRFSALAQVLLDTIGKPEVWLDVHHLKMDIRRGLFLKDAFYVCVEEAGEDVAIDLLPSLPVFIGGYASLLKDVKADKEAAWEQDQQLIKVCIHGPEETLLMEIDQNGVARETNGSNTDFKQYSQETCTNAITMWMLNALKQMKEVTA